MFSMHKQLITFQAAYMLRHSSQRGIAAQHRTRVRTCDSGSGMPNARTCA